jgi:hypothetical protein
MRSTWTAVVVLLLASSAAAVAAEPPALARARMLYNDGRYDAAITAAAEARSDPAFADAAALVMARAHLERFRLGADPADLATARAALAEIRSASLTPRDQIDVIIGLGQTLYLGGSFGAAAEVFDSAVSRAAVLEPRDRLLLLDWWASAVDREAQARPPDGRAPLFERIVERMEQELRLDAGNPVANYWLAVAARGAGDVERAWDAAVAAWVRATLSPVSAERLRADIDRLVTEALILERARTRSPREQQEGVFRAEWEELKEAWP